jgi:alpha-L-fucosidase 2
VSNKSFDEIKKRHIEDYSELFARTDIDFKSKENDTPTDEMLKSGKHYKNLAEKMFSFGKYLMISSSRQGGQAMNLQGIWNEDFRPPWCCNYTLNINT